MITITNCTKFKYVALNGNQYIVIANGVEIGIVRKSKFGRDWTAGHAWGTTRQELAERLLRKWNDRAAVSYQGE
jgi:hypothetical protein